MSSLWQRVYEVTRYAQQHKLQISIPTDATLVHDSGYTFCVRVARSLLLKKSPLEAALEANDQCTNNEKTTKPLQDPQMVAENPFRPYDKAMCVDSHSETDYVLLLNKFNVLNNHLLMISQKFETQTSHPSLRDISALLRYFQRLSTQDSPGRLLGFYNRGLYSGASQPHKHFQLVPLDSVSFPLVDVLDTYARNHEEGKFGHHPDVPFKHAFAVFPHKITSQSLDDPQVADTVHKTLMNALEYTGTLLKERENFEKEASVSKEDLDSGLRSLVVVSRDDDGTEDRHEIVISESKAPSYNFLFTREWLFVVPRRAESAGGFSVNSLGLVNSLFVKTDEQKKKLIDEFGCAKLIQEVTFPRQE